MDKAYADTVRLLLTAAPDVFANDIFAMKGGTAINLFVPDMPRLSVDIDVVYTPRQTPREQALKAISDELDAIAGRLGRLGLATRKVNSKDLGDTKLLIENAEALVKVEVNVIFRGTVLPIERHPLSPKTADLFSVALELPVLAPAELYGESRGGRSALGGHTIPGRRERGARHRSPGRSISRNQSSRSSIRKQARSKNNERLSTLAHKVRGGDFE